MLLIRCFWAAVLVLIFVPCASAAIVTWDGDTNNSIFEGGNWAGGVAPVDNDEAVFPGGLVGGASVTPTVDVANRYLKTVTFANGAPQYTFTIATTKFEFYNPGQNTLVNNSLNTQVIQAVGVADGQVLMAGVLNAANADFVINAPIGVGSNSSSGSNWVALAGSNDFYFNVDTGVHALGNVNACAWTSSTTSSMYSASRGRFFMDNFSGTAYMGNLGTSYAGAFHVNTNANGALRLTHNNALGSQTGTASNTNPGLLIYGGVGGVNPAAGNGTVELDASAAGGAITVGRKILFVDGRSGTIADDPHFLNVNGNNTFNVAGDWNTGFGAPASSFNTGNINLQSDSGKITFTGGPVYNTRPGQFTLQLMGAADGEIASQVTTYQTNPSFNLRKRGAGTWTLSNSTNNYSGTTTIEQGTLSLGTTGTIASSSIVDIKSGAQLDVSGLAGGYTMGPTQTIKGGGTVMGNVTSGAGSTLAPGDGVGTLTMSGDLMLAGGTLQFELSNTPGGSNDLISGIANLTLSGSTVNVTPVGGTLGNGTYTLMTYSGLLSGDAASNLTLTGTPVSPRQTFALSSAIANQINLIVSGSAGNLTWVGGANADAWDVGATVNWTGHPTDNNFYDGDAVTFSDSGTKTPNIVGTVNPGQVTFTNTAGQNYTVTGGNLIVSGNLNSTASGDVRLANGDISIQGGFSQNGTGKLTFANTGTITAANPLAINSGTVAFDPPVDGAVAVSFTGAGTLRKEGATTLTLSGSSTGFDGAVQVAEGTLRVGHSSALGSSVGGTTVANGATLDLNSTDLGAETVTVRGAGVGGNGALINSAAGGGTVRKLVLNADTTINTTGGTTSYFNIGGGPGSLLQGNGHNLTVKTPTEIDIVDVGDAGLGNITIDGGGALYFAGNSTPGTGSGTVHLANVSILGFYGSLSSLASTGLFDRAITVDATGGNISSFQGNKTIDSPTITIASGGNLEFTGLPRNNGTSSTITVNGKVTGQGSISAHREGNGTTSRRALIQLVSNDNDYAGATTIGGGGGYYNEDASQDFVTLSVGNGGATGSLGTGDVTVNALGTLMFNRAATFAVANTISGGGNVSADAAGGVVNLTGSNSYTGTTSVNAGTLNVNGSHTGGGDYTVALGATLGGTGSIGSNVVVNGTLAPGVGVESLDISGTVTLNGALQIEYNGDTDVIDTLNVASTLDITTATISFANLGTGALNGSAHVFATYSSLVGGAFTSVSGLPSGYAIDYDYLGNQIALVSAALPGDFDGDGDVDGADFVVWQTNFPTNSGASTGTGDADGDQDVDGADFAAWQGSFPSGAGASPVPEPPAALLLGIGGLIGLLRRWGRESKGRC